MHSDILCLDDVASCPKELIIQMRSRGMGKSGLRR